MRGERKISELISDIEHRRLILPEFQRGYVWKRDKVRSYINSLYRGYPTGSFLIWSTPDPGRVRGGFNDSDTGDRFFHLILDGQQRLTSVYTVINGDPPSFYEDEKLYFNLYFNLVDEVFVYYKQMLMKDRPEWIPVTSFFQEGLANFIQNRSENDEDVRKLYFDNLAKFQRLEAIRGYSYFTETIDEREIDRVVLIFNLVNSSGTSLSKSDFGLAHICASWPEARITFRQAAERLQEHHFSFGLDILTRLASTVATASALYEPLYNTPIEKVKEAWQRVEPSLEYLVNILRSDAYIDSSDHLKSPFPLIPLVVYLSHNGGAFTSQREKREFLHWMYAALMWGRYTATTDSKLNADVAALDEPNPTVRLRDNIIKERGRIEVQARDLERASVRSTFYPMTYIVARARGAVDWFNGQPLYVKNVGAMFGLETHHIFPTSVLYRTRFSSSEPAHRQVVNEIANLAFLTKQANIKISNAEPLGYLREVKEKYPGALEAQFVPIDESLWTIDRFDDFLAERRRLIATAINQFMEELLADEPEGVPTTIEDLIAQGESTRVEYKGSLRWDYDQNNVNKALVKAVTKTLAAFLNSRGGTLLIGVMDDGVVAGIEKDFESLGSKGNRDGFELTLRDAIGTHIGEDLNPYIEVTFGEAHGRTVAIVSCEPHHRPLFLEDANERVFYVRAGNTSRPLDVKEATEYIASRWPAPALVAHAS
jgi:hypothetical protein